MDPRWGLVICFGTPVLVFGLFMLGLYLANLPYSRRMDRIEQRILAEGRLELPYVFCKALSRPEHDDESGLVMVPYPEAT